MVPERYRLENLLKVFRKPTLILREISKLAVSANAYYYQLKGVTRSDFVEEDWDNLIIIDGCRFDTFREVNHLKGQLECRTSMGSESWEFMRNNFVGKSLHDTVYVTANPHATKIPPNTFHAVENLIESAWDPDLQTVPPERVTEAAEKASQEYPKKRLIVHYMQPHYPFIGETGQFIEHGGFSPGNEATERGLHIWTQLQYGLIDEEIVRTAYGENLQIVLDEVEDLINVLVGKSVVTSDHGNLIGDKIGPVPVEAYGHPAGLHVPELLHVPWLIAEYDQRRDIESDRPDETTEIDKEIVDNRLESLGYKTD